MKSSSSRGSVTGTRSELLDQAPAFSTLILTRSENNRTHTVNKQYHQVNTPQHIP